MLEFSHVSKKYISKPGKTDSSENLSPEGENGSSLTTEALSDVSLKIPQGQVIGLFGENGAGKTTLIHTVFRFIRYEGTITMDGSPVTRGNIDRISLATSQHSFFSPLTPGEHKIFLKQHFPAFDQTRWDVLMEFFGLPSDRKLKSFSWGQQNQFELVMAFSQGADYIFLDEPFAGNDLFNRDDFYHLLMGMLQPHETVILSTHLIEEVKDLVSRVVLLHHGHLIGDTMISDLEDRGETLMSYLKWIYQHDPERVVDAIEKLETAVKQ